MIQINNIEEMLVRFMDGQTTEAEEQQLADFFHTTKDIPDEWKSYQDIFLSFDTDAYAFSEQELDAACKDDKAMEDAKNALPAQSHGTSKWRLIGVAASVALLMGIWGGITHHNTKPHHPALAEKEIRNAPIASTEIQMPQIASSQKAKADKKFENTHFIHKQTTSKEPSKPRTNEMEKGKAIASNRLISNSCETEGFEEILSQLKSMVRSIETITEHEDMVATRQAQVPRAETSGKESSAIEQQASCSSPFEIKSPVASINIPEMESCISQYQQQF